MRTAYLLRGAWLVFVLLGSGPAFAQDAAGQVQSRTRDIAVHVTEASQRFGIPERWIYAVMRVESAGRVDAVSSAGAMGLMQLMPATWARQRARSGLGVDPFDPHDNIIAGASYLRELYDRYGTAGFLAAYNAGPGRYEDWRDRRRPLPAETRGYVARIAPLLQSTGNPALVSGAMEMQPARMAWKKSRLFAARSGDARPSGAEVNRPAPDPAFPMLSLTLSEFFVPVSGSRTQ